MKNGNGASGDLGQVIVRLAVMSNVIRTREEDGHRTALNGGSNGERNERIASAVDRLKKNVAELEKALV